LEIVVICFLGRAGFRTGSFFLEERSKKQEAREKKQEARRKKKEERRKKKEARRKMSYD